MRDGGGGTRNWFSLVEALSVFALVLLYIWSWRGFYSRAWIGLLALVVSTHFFRGETPRYLGFGWKEFRTALPAAAPWVGGAVAAVLACGALLGTLRQTTITAAAAGAAVYVAWGLVQQYLLNGYFVNRLAGFAGAETRLVPLFAALMFSLVHTPNWFLMAVTFAGGYACARLYLRFRSLYVLALAHGLVGIALFLVVPDSISVHFLVGPRYLLDVHWRGHT